MLLRPCAFRGTPGIRSELAPTARQAILRERERLEDTGQAELAAAVECWAADERRRNGARKQRASNAAVAERRAGPSSPSSSRPALAAGDAPLTSRGAAYRLEALGLPKTPEAFRRVEEDALALRDSGLVAWEAVADGARRVLYHGRHADPRGALEEFAVSYRRELRRAAPVQCHVSAQPQVPQRPSRSRSSAVASRTSSSGMPAMCWQ